jgi:hypothetical protein
MEEERIIHATILLVGCFEHDQTDWSIIIIQLNMHDAAIIC